MSDYSAYGDDWAAVYDEIWCGLDSAMIARLAALADGGRVLELGPGTGRVALPLVEAGLEVHGVEISKAMIDQLREKPRGAEVRIIEGSFASFDTDTRFAVAFAAVNTLFMLLTQEEQVSCFECVSRHLVRNGRFVVEGFVADNAGVGGSRALVPRFVVERNGRKAGFGSALILTDSGTVSPDRIVVDVIKTDAVAQTLEFTRAELRGPAEVHRTIKIRYASLGELDLMARIAGFTLESRSAGWSDEPMTPESYRHVSVYIKR